MDYRSLFGSARAGVIVGLLLAVVGASPSSHRIQFMGTGPEVAYAAGCSYFPNAYTPYQALYTGSETGGYTQLGSVSAALTVNSPSYTCDTTFGDTKYWVSIVGPSATPTCPNYPAFAQAGWDMLAAPTNFYEEFNYTTAPCVSGVMYGGSAPTPSATYQVSVKHQLGGQVCPSTTDITLFYVSGSSMGSICSDWQYGSTVLISSERQEQTSHLANTTCSNAAYCDFSGGNLCTPNKSYGVSSSNSVSPAADPCGAYTYLGTSSFQVQDKRDLGSPSC